jgi:hypothetical protein
MAQIIILCSTLWTYLHATILPFSPHPFPQAVKKSLQIERAGRDIGPEREAKAKGRKLPKFYSDTFSR